MAITALNNIKNWFKTGLIPTQQQFWDTLDSFRHKSEKVPVSDIEGIDALLEGKAEEAEFNNHINNPAAHANLFFEKEDKSQKGDANGYAPLNEFIKIASDYLDIVNDVVTGGTTALLSAEQGKVLQSRIEAINLILTSDNINLDTVQELVDAIETVQLSLNTILVNDLTTGGTTKALTAEMGKLLQANKLDKDYLNGDIKFGNYPSTRNDGQLPTNKVLAPDVNGNIKLYTIATAPAPYLEELIPDSYLPSTTGSFILKGSFFTPTMTVTIPGQVINYKNFISDNEVHINVTTGATEGKFDVILNNGISATFTQVLLIVLGTIYKPSEANWTVYSGAPDLSTDGEAHMTTYNSLVNAVWNKQLDFAIDFSLRFRPNPSPLGSPGGNTSTPTIYIVGATDGLVKYEIGIDPGSGFTVVRTNNSDGLAVITDVHLYKKEIEFRNKNGIFYLYADNGLIKTYATALSQSLKLQLYLATYDLIDIKYIELM
ncbi:hypothetical protein [Flavobacterium sp.]|uniref:hypothetical protein n=1 Tax=Flavobacterium sp. TaxID=239 RepID=UPI003266DE58